jgi:glyoxylate/hydroxypyruvate reductase A
MNEARNLLLAITHWPVPAWLRRFSGLMPERRCVIERGEVDLASIGYAATWKHEPGALAGLPNLKAVFSLGAGVDHLFRDTELPDVPLVRIVDPDLTLRMGEWVALHVLSHHREYERYAAQQRQRIWRENYDQPAASQVRVGLLGLGVLGRHAARVLGAIGFDLAGWSRSPREVAGVACFAGEKELPAFLARTDILVCLLPLTADTRGILNRDLFSKLARDGRLGGPVILNAGRGGLQVESDILACLDDGTLKAATLDVFETEPLPPSSPLWLHPRVTITPHNSAMSAPEAVARQVAGQIRRFEAGLPLENRVDPRAGY